ncbi:hypothetical protein S83_064146 [Arachis hypogaea]
MQHPMFHSLKESHMVQLLIHFRVLLIMLHRINTISFTRMLRLLNRLPKLSKGISTTLHLVLTGSVPAGFVDNQFADYDPDMDVEYLRMQFPGISEESLRDVYMVNECDIDAAVEMLNQLELKFDGVESSGSLPETLDIGDVSESGSASDSASLKLKNVAAEASTSTSSSHLSANTL